MSDASPRKSPLHRAVGEALRVAVEKFPGARLLLDKACDPSAPAQIPLFGSTDLSRRTCLCSVDAAVLDPERRLRLIVEIEESNVKPTQVCGKFLTAAFSEGASYRGHFYAKASSVHFIQVLDTSRLKIHKTSKVGQWTRIEEAIGALPTIGNITEYTMICGHLEQFQLDQPGCQQLFEAVGRALA